jgi:tetratricopeptide (TPR) repeat protein
LDQAADLIGKAIAQDTVNAVYRFNLGVVLQKQGRLDQAVDAYRHAVTLNPSHVEAQGNLANLLREQNRYEDAVAACRQALRVRPDYVEAHNTLGAALKDLGRLDEAVAAYERALQINPNHVEALCNLGTALREQGRLEESVRMLERTLTLKPEYAKAHHNVGLTYLWQERLDDAFRALRQSAELQHNHGRPVGEAVILKSRLRHDTEQIDYLEKRGLLGPEHAGYAAALRALEMRAREDVETVKRLSLGKAEMTALAPSFNRILHYADCPALPNGALNPALDAAAIEARYHASRPEILYVDDLLSPEALHSLRRFCLESTIWKKDYENGYVGAMLGEGFACPVLLQIAEELRLTFPRIFTHHRLTQAWSFKHDSLLRGLNIHADAAAVNVNFWITPDEANLDPGSGGLEVWDKEAPREWNFKEYNSQKNEPKIREFLARSGAQAVRVPHRQNRAVIFNSDLFHETDTLRFREGYEHRRINVTMLYGFRFG